MIVSSTRLSLVGLDNKTATRPQHALHFCKTSLFEVLEKLFFCPLTSLPPLWMRGPCWIALSGVWKGRAQRRDHGRTTFNPCPSGETLPPPCPLIGHRPTPVLLVFVGACVFGGWGYYIYSPLHTQTVRGQERCRWDYPPNRPVS